MTKPPRIQNLPPDEVFDDALKVVQRISEALELTPAQRYQAALALDAEVGEADVGNAYARLARAVALQLRENGA